MAALNEDAIHLVESQQQLGEQQLVEVFNYLKGQSTKWKTIGLQLGIPLHRLDEIESNESNLDNKLMRMISDWLKRVYDEDKWGAPSWKKLADVVDDTDKMQAERIRKQHSRNTQEKRSPSKGSRCRRSHESTANNSHGPQIFSISDTHGKRRVPVEESDSCCCCCWRSGKSNFRRSDPQRRSSASSQSARTQPVADPRTLLSYHDSYHGYLTGAEAERKLKENRDSHCYLIRYSRRKRSHVLSVKYMKQGEQEFLHVKIMMAHGKFQLETDGQPIEFESLQALLYHYQENPLCHEIFGIGKECKSEKFTEQQSKHS